MNKFQSFIKNNLSFTSVLIKQLPVTYISVCITTLMAAVSVALELTEGSNFYCILTVQMFLTLLFFSVGAFLLESMENADIKISKLVKVPVLAIWLAFSACLVATVDEERAFLKGVSVAVRSRVSNDRLSVFTVGLLLVMIAVAFYFQLIAHKELSFGAYLTRVYGQCFMSGIIYSVLSMGMLFLVLIFTALLWGQFDVIYMVILVIITGLFYAPNVLRAIVISEEENKFIQVLVKYVMLILSIAAYVIIYVYMAKILILKDIPSNSIFEILTALFLVTTVICLMCRAYPRDGFLQQFAYHQPFVFAPFLILQGYAVFARIHQYGVTRSRYLGVAYLLFETLFIILYLVSYLLKKEELIRFALPLFAAVTLVSCVIPYVNAVDFCERRGIVESGSSNSASSVASEFVSYCDDTVDLDISGYTRMRPIWIDHYEKVDVTNLSVDYYGTKESIMRIDLSDLIQEMTIHYRNRADVSDCNYEIDLESSKLILTEVNIRVGKQNDSVFYVNAMGYLLDR